jgi:uncharacterized membrane protein
MTMKESASRPVHPALIAHKERRATDTQSRVADAITGFAGSMPFVYVHLVWFAIWITSGVEAFPFGLLTMIVSLEAIFLSTFVMISQNRSDERREALADHQWEMIQLEKTQNEDLLGLVQLEKAQNEELLEISKHLLDLTTNVHDLTARVHTLIQQDHVN